MGQRTQALRSIITGSSDALNQAKQWGIDYVCLTNGRDQFDGFNINFSFLEKEMTKVYSDRYYTVYEVKKKRRFLKKMSFGPLVHK